MRYEPYQLCLWFCYSLVNLLNINLDSVDCYNTLDYYIPDSKSNSGVDKNIKVEAIRRFEWYIRFRVVYWVWRVLSRYLPFSIYSLLI